MVVLLEPRLGIVPTVRFRLTLHINMIAIVHPKAFRSLNAETQRIGTWRVGVVCHDHGLPIGTLDHGRHDVAQVKTHVSQRMMLTTVIDDGLMQTPTLCRH